MSAEGSCMVCRGASKLKCSNCQEVFYCSKAHQKQDWCNHKLFCLSYKIIESKELGRHIVCTRIISEGEIILKEAPVVVGPSQITPPVCLGCYNLLTKFNKRDCSLCGWPICSVECEKSPSHLPECEITSIYKKKKVKINDLTNNLAHPSYQCLTVLRCLYLKKKQPNLWEKLNSLESHCAERKTTAKYKSDEIFIAKFIHTFFNYLEFSEEEILKVVGIVQVNAHEIPLKEPGYIAVYDKASFLEHSCRANCMKSFTNSGELVIRAAMKILPGQHLSICYTDPLWGREMRINHLMETKFFLCQCIRCSDPTEMGTHFNSFKCINRNCKGCVVPPLNLSSIERQTLLDDTTWNCQKCGITITGKTLIDDVYHSFFELNTKNEKFCMEYLRKYENILHSNHHLLVSIKLSLVDIFTWKEQLLLLEEKKLKWTIKTCRELCELAFTLVPAENRLRGVLLFQLYLAMSELGRRNATKRETTKKLVEENLQECKKILWEAYKMLQYEPNELPEGKIAIEAKKALDLFQTQ